MRPDDIDITVTGDQLTIRGELREHAPGDEARFHQREHRYGSFARSLTLPIEVQPDKVEATFEHGVLTLTMPKAERMRPKQIKINARGGATSIDARRRAIRDDRGRDLRRHAATVQAPPRRPATQSQLPRRPGPPTKARRCLPRISASRDPAAPHVQEDR